MLGVAVGVSLLVFAVSVAAVVVVVVAGEVLAVLVVVAVVAVGVVALAFGASCGCVVVCLADAVAADAGAPVSSKGALAVVSGRCGGLTAAVSVVISVSSADKFVSCVCFVATFTVPAKFAEAFFSFAAPPKFKRQVQH